MNPERWKRVKEVVNQVMQWPEPDRIARLDAMCGADVELASEVKSLLARMTHDDGDVGDDAAMSADVLRNAIIKESRQLKRDGQFNDAETLRATLQTNLFESYEILSTLGVGGMGTVFLAKERALDRFVAIKTLRREHAVTPHSRERFRREARIAAQLSHPGILPLYAFGEVSGLWYLVMGYVRGQTLAQRIRSAGAMHHTQVVQILRAVAESLEHAHQRHVIHRDIKPANILLDEESGRPLLADFGISKAIGHGDTLTHSGDVLGTPQYMAPEQILSAQDSTPASDIYALGAVGYAMLTGHAPFSTVSDSELLATRAALEVPSLLSTHPNVPRELSTIVMKCLATRPELRYQNARQFIESLDHVNELTASQVTPKLREVAGFGAYATAWFMLWTALAFALIPNAQRWPFFLFALLVPLGLLLQISRSRESSTGWLQLSRVAFWPPVWWGMWWPKRLRRPDDLWNRLPWFARTVRTMLSICILALPVLVVGAERLLLLDSAGAATGRWNLAFGALVAVAATALTGGVIAARRFRLQSGDTMQFLVGPTVSSDFWKQPDVVQALQADASGVRAPAHDVPSDYVRAIEEVMRASAIGAAAAREQPVIMARRITSALSSLSREVSLLERDASREAIDRVSARLASLTSGLPNAREEHRELIIIVESELQLLRRMEQRRVLALNEHSELFAVLREMWEVVSHQQLSANDAAQSSRLSNLMHDGAQSLARQASITPA